MSSGRSQTPLSQRVRALPARDLTDATRVCDPYEPLDAVADEALHVEFDALRGGPRLDRIGRNIRRSGSTTTLHFLSGHMGCGKTTELRRLARALERAAPGAGDAMVVVYVDADALLDQRDIEVEDVVLAVWAQVAATTEARFQAPLRDAWSQHLFAHAQRLGLDIPEDPAEGVSRLVGLLKLSPRPLKEAVRSWASANMETVVGALNDAFALLRGPRGERSVAIFIDNLEKLALARREAVEHLYLNRLGALKRLAAHLVVTVPLFLVYSAEGGGLTGLWGGETVILPMVKVRNHANDAGQDVGPYAAGVDAVVDMLTRRVDFAALFETGREAAAQIARWSGGCLRHALRLTTLAMDEHDAPPVTTGAVAKAADILGADFDRALEERLLPVLLHVSRTNEFPQGCEADLKRVLLRNLFVLEYQNGDPRPWHAVHPLVERLPRFIAAKKHEARRS